VIHRKKHMRSPFAASPRRAAALAVPALALTALLALTGCSSNSAPAGLGGKQASQLNSQQYSAADRAAATTLKPAQGSFLDGKTTVTRLASTTPANGDLNPYALWPVTRTGGSLTAGDVLVDNFNNKSNDQGTGTTIVDVHPDGSTTVFAALPQTLSGCPGGVGLTTAMVQLASGWVIVGSAPTTDGKIDTAGSGCLIELSPTGQVGGTISGDGIDGPWDATVSDNGTAPVLFVTNTYNGVSQAGSSTVDKGSVIRLTLTEGSAAAAPQVTAATTIVSALPERADASSLVKGPTGLALGSNGTLYIADNLGNSITSVAAALTTTQATATGSTVTSGGQLAGPLGMTIGPDGDLLVANAVNGKIVEVTPAGKQVGEFYAIQDVGQDPPGSGDLFGIAVNQAGTGVLFVGDDNNDLLLLH
jgi:hypothetical protein